MKYWVIKGSPRENNWDAMLKPGTTGTWHTKRPPFGWQKGDRIFCWESTPYKRIIGLAELQIPLVREDGNGEKFFRIRYLTKRLQYMPDIHELRDVEELQNAVFLKSGPAMTVLPVTDDEAGKLFSILLSGSPDLKPIWPDIAPATTLLSLPDVDFSANEGKSYLATHLRRERNTELVAKKKKQVYDREGKLACEVCDFDFAKVYGQLGREFCEVHHRQPLSKVKAVVQTKLSDLAIVCSNCHSMLHRPSNVSIAGLRQLLNNK